MTTASHQSEQTSQSLFDKLPQITSRNYRDELNRLFQYLLTLYQLLMHGQSVRQPPDKELITRYSDEVLKKLRNVEIEEEKLQFNLCGNMAGAEQKEV